MKYEVGMRFRRNHMCSDNDVEIVKIGNGIVTLRETSDRHNDPNNYWAGERDETGHLIEELPIDYFEGMCSEKEYIPTNR